MIVPKIRARLAARGLLGEAVKVAQDHGVTFAEIAGKRRTKKVVQARHAAWRQIHAHGFSLHEIGALWGVDHSSVWKVLQNAKKGND